MDNNTLKTRPSIVDVLSRDPENKVSTENSSVKNNQNHIPTQTETVPPKEIIKERVVVQYRDKDNGCLPRGCGCGCRAIGCGGCLFVILIIVGFAYILINKPAFIWTEVVSFMNNEVSAPAYKPQDLTNLQDSINSQISNIGEVNINLTQDQLTTLIRDKAPQLKDLTMEVTHNKLSIYWDIDNTLPSKPMYGIVDIQSQDSGNLAITRIGTGRIPLPDFVNKFATNSIYSLLNVGDSSKPDSQTPLSILTSLFDSNNITVKSVTLEEGVVKITADIKVNLFNQQ